MNVFKSAFTSGKSDLLLRSPKVRFWCYIHSLLLSCLLLSFLACETAKQPIDNQTERPIASTCEAYESLPEKGWLAEKVDSLEAYQVTRYPFRTDGWAYLLEGSAYELYDCQGNFMCRHAMVEAQSCMTYIKPTDQKQGVVIWRDK